MVVFDTRLVPTTKGDQAGVADGMKSGTAGAKCCPKQISSTLCGGKTSNQARRPVLGQWELMKALQENAGISLASGDYIGAALSDDIPIRSSNSIKQTDIEILRQP
ncbi:hypothetical protein [Stenotrophomonas maltophilia]|uniref:hypothetical protein n=1 Tax=Stenotrophomonas maltophilia TaxID=40324 RepID=UPI001B3076FE|nr:hypothetical protein [Stenotrophomonas maltophilia]